VEGWKFWNQVSEKFANFSMFSAITVGTIPGLLTVLFRIGEAQYSPLLQPQNTKSSDYFFIKLLKQIDAIYFLCRNKDYCGGNGETKANRKYFCSHCTFI
jgi:hypothetical protein